VERVDGGGHGDPNRDRPGLAGINHNVPLWESGVFIAISHVTVGIQHRSATTLYKGSVACERSPQ
jgi:hypothetical protein